MRDEQGVFVAEGPALVDAAVKAGAPIEAIFAEPGAAATLTECDAPVYAVAKDALRGVLDAATPQGVAAVVRTPSHDLDAVIGTGVLVVLAGIADPGNAGSLIRSAEASAAAAVVCCEGSVDPFSPKCVRASAGSIFRIPVVMGGRAAEVLERIGGAGVCRWATATGAGIPYSEAPLDERSAIVLGNEAHGLPADCEGRVDGYVTIPMAGEVESLNVAVAGSVLLFDVARRRAARTAEP